MKPEKHKEFYLNTYESFKSIEKFQASETVPFIVFFIVLFSLQKYLPGRPWVIPVSIVGILYGFFTQGTDMRPTILADEFP